MIINKKRLPLLALAVIPLFVLALSGQTRAQGASPYHIYFGNLHSHTSYSDGVSVPAQAYQHAKNSGLGDFLALSDHARLLDAAEWADTKTQADKFTDATFTSMAGFEFNTASGHLNIYNTEWFTNGLGSIAQAAFYDYLVANRPGSIAQWNHPLSSDGGIGYYGDFSAGRDTVVELMEVVNKSKRYEASYIKALDAGWHIAPTAGQDNHSADWLTGRETRTAVMAVRLTRNDIYAALKAHRVYATEDRNLKISYGINGNILGSTISARICHVSIHVEDPDINIAGDTISRVEIVRDKGNVVAVQVPNAYSTDWTPTIEPCDAPYYFVRVTNAANEKAWTAPIWRAAVGVMLPLMAK